MQMSYCYQLEPIGSSKIIRKCSSCGCDRVHTCADTFRINANGKKIDIWLLYQCDICDRTYNLAIYERRTADSIPSKLYQDFLNDDPDCIKKFARDKSILHKNHVREDDEPNTYRLLRLDDEDGDLLTFQNPYGIKVREEALLAEILGFSKSKVKNLIKEGEIFPLPRRYNQPLCFTFSPTLLNYLHLTHT
jgi:hypothetical protein